MALVPNLRGASAALDRRRAQAHVPVSASAAHSLANVRKTREQMVDEVRAIVALRDERAPASRGSRPASPPPSAARMQGSVDEDEVLRPGRATGGRRRRRMRPVRHHRHGQPGAGAAAVHARCAPRSASKTGARAPAQHARPGPGQLPGRLDVGVRTFDASLGGLGGCPYAPGAIGQRRHRGPGVHVRGHGRAPPASTSPRLIAARAVLRRGAARRAALRHDARGRPAARASRPRHERRRAAAAGMTLAHARPAAGRHARRRVHPHGDGPDLRHDPRRPRRRGDQGRAAGAATTRAGCSAPAPASSRCSTATRRAWRSTSSDPRGLRDRAEAGRRRRRVQRELQGPARCDKLGLGYDALSRLNPRPDLRARTRASCPAPTSSAPRSTRWCR